MTNGNLTEPGVTPASGRTRIDFNWTRLEGLVGVGTLLTSFLWFLGMPTAMAIAVGFGIVLVLDFVRVLVFRSSHSELGAPELARH